MSKKKLFTLTLSQPLDCPHNNRNHEIKFGYDCYLDPDITCPCYVNIEHNGFQYPIKTFPENCPLEDVYNDDEC